MKRSRFSEGKIFSILREEPMERAPGKRSARSASPVMRPFMAAWTSRKRDGCERWKTRTIGAPLATLGSGEIVSPPSRMIKTTDFLANWFLGYSGEYSIRFTDFGTDAGGGPVPKASTLPTQTEERKTYNPATFSSRRSRFREAPTRTPVSRMTQESFRLFFSMEITW